MLDHLIFNKLKWFNISDDMTAITANGKNWLAHPKSVKIGAVHTGYVTTGITSSGTFNCIGSFISNSGSTFYVLDNDGFKYIVQKTDVTSENWGGGRSPLKCLFQRIKSLLYPTKEVA